VTGKRRAAIKMVESEQPTRLAREFSPLPALWAAAAAVAFAARQSLQVKPAFADTSGAAAASSAAALQGGVVDGTKLDVLKKMLEHLEAAEQGVDTTEAELDTLQRQLDANIEMAKQKAAGLSPADFKQGTLMADTAGLATEEVPYATKLNALKKKLEELELAERKMSAPTPIDAGEPTLVLPGEPSAPLPADGLSDPSTSSMPSALGGINEFADTAKAFTAELQTAAKNAVSGFADATGSLLPAAPSELPAPVDSFLNESAPELALPAAFVAANVLVLLGARAVLENSDSEQNRELERDLENQIETSSWSGVVSESGNTLTLDHDDPSANGTTKRNAPTIFLEGVGNLAKDPLGWLEARPPLGSSARASEPPEWRGTVVRTEPMKAAAEETRLMQEGDVQSQKLPRSSQNMYEEQTRGWTHEQKMKEDIRLAQGLVEAPPRMSEEEAIWHWCETLDAPTWGRAAEKLSNVASEAANAEELAAACDNGNYVACEHLSREEEAKRAYLSKLDAPTLKVLAATVSAFALETQSAAQMDQLAAACEAGDYAACDNLSRVVEAKRASLERQAPPSFGTTVAAASARLDANRGWIPQQQQPSWGEAATTLASVASEAAYSAEVSADMTAACDQGIEVACDNLSREEEAKLAWLAKLDAPTWGKAATAVSAIAFEKSRPTFESS
jgi:hypothetical protein